jgi:hypothetical protein
MTLRLSYSKARSLIKNGDMIGVHTGTLGGHIIQAGQVIAGLPYSHITHCAIAVWRENRLMVAEMGPSGNTLKYASQYAGKPMVVCEPAAGADLSLFESALDIVLEHHIPYSAGDLARIGGRLLPMRLIDTRHWGGDGNADKVCSLFPAMVYTRMGGDVSAIPSLAAPAEVVCALPVRFEIGVK